MQANSEEARAHPNLAIALGLGLFLALNVAPQVNGGRTCFHFLWALVAGLALAALAYRARPQGTPLRELAPWIAAALVCFGIVGGASGEHGATHVTATIAGGLGTGYLLCRWFQALCFSTLREALVTVLLAFTISALARVGAIWIMELPSWISGFTMSLVTLASTALAFAPRREAMGEPASAGMAPPPLSTGVEVSAQAVRAQGRRLAIIGVTMAELAAYALVFGLLRTDLLGMAHTSEFRVPGQLIQAAIPLLLFAYVALEGDGHARRGLAKAALFAVAVVVLAAVFFSGAVSSTLAVIMFAVRCLISILIFVRLLHVTFQLDAHPVVVFGLGRAWFGLVFCAGLILYDVVVSRNAIGALPVNVVYFGMSLLALLLLGSLSSMSGPSGDVRQREGADTTPTHERTDVPAPISLDKLCDVACARFGLSDREGQVLRLTVAGLSKKEIATRLFLSEDTIRYHTKTLYKKLDVHDRQELMLIVVGAATGGDAR